ncbi:FGGY-family carbohydrate kinase [Thioclava sp. BHET1]|nr:FGGY-family carbohydrate kinase [Thioclava sp. BHET1]
MEPVFLGIDVGTGSARAGVFDPNGQMLGAGKHSLEIRRAPGGVVEQSGDQVWQAVCRATRAALAVAAVDPAQVAGVSFDATCSLVVVGEAGASLPVSDPDHPDRNIIVWMDHRARDQARRINATRHRVLDYVGGRISPEMQTPKLLWLREHRPEIYARAAQFFDLTDFLTWKTSGSLARSTCTVTCKWTYLAHEGRWDADYFHRIGLADLAEDAFERIGAKVVDPGTALGAGMTNAAASDLGLRPGIAVGAGLIDAHAGGLATVAAEGGKGDPTACLGYVFGTSSCTMTTTRDPVFVPGVWGPYFSAMAPGMWLNEGGQSAAGAAIDQLIAMHPASAEATEAATAEGKSVPQFLADRALALAGDAQGAARLAEGVHVVPEFLGNRAPFADPEARAIVSGLGMERDLDSLVALYVAGICGLASGLRQIIEAQAAHGALIDTISISGGAGAHPLTRRILADVTRRPVEVTESPEPVLLGAAMLAAVAAGTFPDLASAMKAMSRVTERCSPAEGEIAQFHSRRHAAFLALQDCARKIHGGTPPLPCPNKRPKDERTAR